jgi:glycosyltransferase involved in cell wall biosynthesis
MRVLHLTAGKMFGGVENSLLTIARHASACPPLEPSFGMCFEGRLNAELRETGWPVHVLGGARIRWPWTVSRARHRLADVLAREQPDVAICHSTWPHVLFAPVVRSRGIPLGFWAHDMYEGHHWLERWAGRTPPDLILVNSRYTQSLLRNIFPGAPSVVIHQPVAPPAADLAGSRRLVRAELKTPDDTVVIIQSCRLEPWKGHRLLFDALGRLADVPGWACWIVGGAQRPHEEVYLAELRRQATALGIGDRVRFLGQRSDVRSLLAAADIHCQPNTGPEPFGVAFVEALHAGLPVVTTAMGGALEIVDESCGILVQPGATEELASVLLRLIRDGGLRTRLGANGPGRARHLSDPVSQLRKLVDNLSELVGSGARV